LNVKIVVTYTLIRDNLYINTRLYINTHYIKHLIRNNEIEFYFSCR